MPTEKIEITTQAGHSLSGALEMPTGMLRGAALFAHCFTCTKASKAAIAVTRALAAQGIATLRFDFTGLGASEGEFGRAGFASDVDDLVASARYLIDRFGGKILLVGHSLGGAAVLAAADDIGEVAGVATIGAPSDVPHVLHNIKGDLQAIETTGEGSVSIGGQTFSLSQQFIDRTKDADLLSEVKKLRVPLMIMHAPTDDIVSIDHAGKLFNAAKHPKSFVSLHGADHLLLQQEDAEFAATIVAGWATRYLDKPADLPQPEEGVIVRTGFGKFGTEVHTKSHHFVADEPASYGGDDTGPTPYDLLLAALGTCTAMTMKMYADRKKWPLTSSTIALRHDRNHADDCDHCADGAQIQALHYEIELSGDLTDEQHDKIIEIAKKCPVHRTLTSELHIHGGTSGNS